MAKVKDLLKQKFGKLTVIAEDPIREQPGGHTRWLCKCECGDEAIIRGSNLTAKKNPTRSCGCIASEVTHNRNINTRKHHPSIATAKYVHRNNYSDGDIEFENFYELSQKNCFYCGNEPCCTIKRFGKLASDFYKENCAFTYNGLDRIDSNIKVHNKNNCITACILCNQAKNNLTVKAFIDLITNIVYMGRNHKNFEINIPTLEQQRAQLFNEKLLYTTTNGFIMATGIYSKFKNRRARRYGDGSIPHEILYYLMLLNCFYCGAAPNSKLEHNGTHIYTNGLDRVINYDNNGNKTKHTIDNVVPCCITCNFAKNDNSYEDFIKWAERVYSNKDKIMKLIVNF